MGTNNFQTYRFDCEASVPNDRVRAFALWEGWHGYDRRKYHVMLQEAFEPFVQFIPEPPTPVPSNTFNPTDDFTSLPLFAALTKFDS